MPGPNDIDDDVQNNQVDDNSLPNTDDQPDKTGGGTPNAGGPPASKDPLESMLDKHMEETDGPKGRRGTPPADQTQDQNKQPQKAKEPDPNQPPQRMRQGDGRFAPDNRVPAAKRQYGDLFYADQQGNILNARGQLVAKQGYGRTVFHQMYPYIETLATENAAYKNRLDNYERANELAKQNGLTLDDQGAAMQLMVSWKKDKAGTLKTLLRIAQESGTDVTSIAGGGGLDPAALRTTMEELLDKRFSALQPLIQQINSTREQQEQNEAAMTEYYSFMEEFPDAAPHQMSIANVMRDHNMTHREAYFALRALAASKQLDWSLDLAPQLAKLAKSPNGQASPPGSGQDRALPPMRGGRNDTGATTRAGARDGGTGEESWDHLLRKTFKQHGIDI